MCGIYKISREVGSKYILKLQLILNKIMISLRKAPICFGGGIETEITQ